jgi:RNA polymerase sigma factor (sigma-70 family)
MTRETVRLTKEEEIEAFQRGDYDLLVRSQMPLVHKIAYQVCRNECELEDTVSDGYLELCKIVPRFKPELGNRLITFVYRCLKTAMVRKLSRQGRIPIVAAEIEYLEAKVQEEAFDPFEYVGHVQNVVDDLNPHQKFVVKGLLAGRTYPEMAQELGVSRPTLYALRKSAINVIREKLGAAVLCEAI